ncbi:MAG: AraC family transcriptional regulator, partial [Actinomycetota bacterium]
VRSYSVTHPPGLVALPTEPGWDQIVYANAGLVTAQSGSHAWTVPVHRALCVPDGHRLRIETTRRTPIRCLYARRSLDLLGDEVRVVNLTPLATELIRHAIVTAPFDLDEPANGALLTLLAEHLAGLPDAPLQLPFPTDRTARGLARSIVAEPSRSLDDHLRTAAASRRSLERWFRAETRMSLGQWRRRARILAAVAMLAEGDSVSSVSDRVGYASPSSFIAAFRTEFGATPREFMGNT